MQRVTWWHAWSRSVGATSAIRKRARQPHVRTCIGLRNSTEMSAKSGSGQRECSKRAVRGRGWTGRRKCSELAPSTRQAARPVGAKRHVRDVQTRLPAKTGGIISRSGRHFTRPAGPRSRPALVGGSRHDPLARSICNVEAAWDSRGPRGSSPSRSRPTAMKTQHIHRPRSVPRGAH